MFRLAPWFDLVPRAGISIANAGLSYASGQSCISAGTAPPQCTTIPGDSVSLTLVAASFEALGAFRLTQTFNLLAGLAYDHVISASGSNTNGSNGASTDAHADGKYLGFQFWLGLGGYVL